MLSRESYPIGVNEFEEALTEAQQGIVRSDLGLSDELGDLLESIALEASAGRTVDHLAARARRVFARATVEDL